MKENKEIQCTAQDFGVWDTTSLSLVNADVILIALFALVLLILC